MSSAHIDSYVKAVGCSIDQLGEAVLTIARTSSINPQVNWRIKDPSTLEKKMRLKNTLNIFLINDVYGIRVLVDTVKEAYAVLIAIQNSFLGFVGHDYIATPKTRTDKPHLIGKSLRLIQFVAYKNHAPFEIQITTKEFHKLNERLHEEYHLDKYK